MRGREGSVGSAIRGLLSDGRARSVAEVARALNLPRRLAGNSMSSLRTIGHVTAVGERRAIDARGHDVSIKLWALASGAS
jgi:hypothetical protein